jgi:DNA-binding MarR family transcriptional regulator
MLLLFI